MNKEKIQIIKDHFSSLKEKKFPISPDRDDPDYASTFADIVLIESQLAGLLYSLFGSYRLSNDEMKLFIHLRDNLTKELNKLKGKDDNITRYFSELLEIINMAT